VSVIRRVSSTYLAAVARLSRPLRVGKLPLHRGGEVVVVVVVVVGGDVVVLRRARRDAMLDALDLADELRFVLRGPLRGHVAANEKWRTVCSDGKQTVGTVGVGWWLDYGARLTLSVELSGIHGLQPESAREK
jgi:hypothetical protein